MENDDRRGGSDVSTRLTYLLIGGGIGAIIALLFAPKAGSELRGDIADVTRKGGQLSAAVEAGKQAYNEEKRRTELSGASEAQPTYPPQGDLS